MADLEFKKRLWSLYNPKTGLLFSSCVSCLVDEKMRKTIRKMDFRILCFYVLYYFYFGLEVTERGDSIQLGKVVEFGSVWQRIVFLFMER